nr:hypothetical protein [Tanacetum cinerariifolium]
PPPSIIGGGTGDNPQVVSISNLDAGNPLYVHNSDNSSSVLVPFMLLGTENYRIWNNAMKLTLQARNKYGFVDGTCLKDSYADSDVLCAQWNRCNAMVLTWFMIVVSSDVYMGLVYSENAVNKIRCVKQGGSTVADYYHKMNSLWRELNAITKVPKCVCPVKCSCAASTELALPQQLMKLMQFLMGLDECYQPVRTALLTRDPLPNVKDAYATISREESHKGIPETLEAINTKMHATPFAAKSYNQNKGDQMQKLLNLINDSTSRNTQANMAGRVSFVNGNAWFNVNFSKFYCGNTKFLIKTITLGWIIDFGANQHLTTSTIGMTNVVDISNLNITVGHPNGTVATISHIGELRLSNNMILHDVLIVPGYCVSMLSVNKLIKDSKLFVGFDEDKCYIQDLDKGITLGTGSESAKQIREPFPLSDHKSVNPGELVHLDLWGPYKVSSREGFRYFLTIVDDYSKAV